MIYDNFQFNRCGDSGVIIRAAKLIAKQPVRDCCGINSPIIKKRRLAANLDFLIGGGIRWNRSSIVVELGMSDLMDRSGNRLHLAHIIPDGNALFFGVKVTVHRFPDVP